MTKKILDATCGSKMMWFDKKHHLAIYTDKRKENVKLCDGRTLEVKPDIMANFRTLPFNDQQFYLVVFDPPHLVKLGENTWLAHKYGRLFPGWEAEIKGGFDECWRVLKTNGTLIFKWSEGDISVKKIIDIIKKEPLFGHTTGKSGKTKWMTFFKEYE